MRRCSSRCRAWWVRWRARRSHPGDNVCIIGAGPMGALFAMVAKAHGAGRVIMADIAPYRLEFVEEVLGVAPVNSKAADLQNEVMALTGIGCDLVIDAVGNQLPAAMKLARRRQCASLWPAPQ